MNDLQKNILEENIGELFGFKDLSPEEKAELLDEVGAVILESAVLRFMAASDEPTIEKFETITDTYAESEDLFPKLQEAFPAFSSILEEEIVSFKDEAKAVLAA